MHTHLLSNMRTYPKAWLGAVVLSIFWLAASANLSAVFHRSMLPRSTPSRAISTIATKPTGRAMTALAPGDIKIEAESAVLTGVDIVTTVAGYSGTGYAWNFDMDTDNILFNVPNVTAGEYELTIVYYSPYGEKHTYLQVNGGSNIDQKFNGTGEGFSAVSAGKFQLVNGLNTIKMTDFYGYYGIDYIILSPVTPPAVPQPLKLEAESAVLTGVDIVTTVAGYSGTGYAWNFDMAADNILFNVPITTAGQYELTIVYYSPYGEKHTYLQVNEGTQIDQQFNGTGEGFASVVAGKFQLTAGQNTIRMTDFYGYYGIDYILLTPVANTPPPVTVYPLVNGRIEAELGVLDGVEVSTAPAGFSGTGYVTGFDGATDKVTLSFSATAGLYDLSLGYTSPFDDKGYDFQLNDEKGSGFFTKTDTFGEAKTGKFLLKQGVNTLTITRGYGYFGVDYAQFTPATVQLPVKPPKILSDSKATPSTKGLFSYIIDQYGSKMLSGQHDETDYILQQTGKEPALASYDLIEYSPSRIEYGSNPAGTTERYINWAKKGDGNGILSIMWHWNAPTDLINLPPDKYWYFGFYTNATTFDLAAALADKNGAKYKLLIRDMDAIAVELKKFQDADVPILWRPLHEAPGAFFWWGAKGSGAFKELWQIMYDRYTNYHKLHNLIWVWAGTDTMNLDWYPGDAYVDIVGLDIYADASANMSGNWSSAKTPFDGKKMVALTETGNLPDPAKVRAFATWWSWFSVWTGDFIRKQPLDVLKAIYNDKDVITRDQVPNWRALGQTPVTGPLQIMQPLYNCQTGAITFQTSGGDGTPIEFRAVGVTDWTTNPNAVVDFAVRRDSEFLTYTVRQSGKILDGVFALRSFCSGQAANLPPVFNGPTTPQSATVGVAFSYQLPASLFTDPESGALTLTATNLPAGLIFTAGNRTISGTPTAFGSTVVTLTAVDPTNAATSGPLTINVAGANGAQPLTLIQPLYNCQTGAITFQSAGGDGTPIEYRAVGVTDWTTNPNAVIDFPVRRDSEFLTYTARQSGKVLDGVFMLRAFCGGQAANLPPVFNGPTTPQSATVGVAFSYQLPASLFTDPENGALTLTATNLPAGLIFTAGNRTISGTPTAFGSTVVTLTAVDPTNAATSGLLTINVAGANGAQPLTLIQPLYNCQTGAITFQSAGGDGTPIEYRAVGVTDWTTNPNAVIDFPVRRDSEFLTYTARQSGKVITGVFYLRAYCAASGRLSAEEAPMQVRVLGNPVNDQLTIEITGAAGQALQLSLTDVSGRVVEQRTVEQASTVERQVFDMRRQPASMLLLSVSHNGQTERVKLIKQ